MIEPEIVSGGTSVDGVISNKNCWVEVESLSYDKPNLDKNERTLLSAVIIYNKKYYLIKYV